MGERVLGSLAALLAVAGMTWAQGGDKVLPPLQPREPAPFTPPSSSPPSVPGGPISSEPNCPEYLPGCAPPAPCCDAPECPKPPQEAPPWAQLYSNCGPCWWVDGEWLNWRFKNMFVPGPLLTTGLETNPPQAGFGVIGRPGTQVLLNNLSIDNGRANGGRATIGGWIEPYRAPGAQAWGFEASIFALGRVTSRFDADASALGSPLLARPVVDATTGQNTALVVTAPGLFGGGPGAFHYESSTELWGAEANLFRPLIGKCHFLLGALVGFRYLNLEESFDVSSTTTTALGNGVTFFNGIPVRMPDGITVNDDFETRNNFYGGQVGLQATYRYNAFSITGVGKLGMGDMHEAVIVNGQTTLLQGGQPIMSTPGGLYALGTNSGGHSRDAFALVPEGKVTLSYQVFENVALNVGYSFLYINNVVRPGDHIDNVINQTQLPSSQTFGPLMGPARPAIDLHESSFWAQGVSAGLSINF